MGSAVEGLASVIVVWRFTGDRTLSETAERRAQRGLAVSFWPISPYIAARCVADLVTVHQAEGTLIGIVLTAVALLEMPLLGYSKHKLGAQLTSGSPPGREPKTTCAAPRPRRYCSCSPSRPSGPATGGSIPPSASVSPPLPSARALRPGAARTADADPPPAPRPGRAATAVRTGGVPVGRWRR